MVNRQDFRPNTTSRSGLSDKQRAFIKSKYGEKTPRRDSEHLSVGEKRSIGRTSSTSTIKSFINGESKGSSKDNLHTDGNKLYSYNTCIAVKNSDGTYTLNNTKYSATTNKQQKEVEELLQANHKKYDVTGGKQFNYEGEDFTENAKSNALQVKKQNEKYSMTTKKNWLGMNYYEVKNSKGKVVDTGTLDNEDLKERKERYNINE